MGKGQHLRPQTRAIIVRLSEAGHSQREIGYLVRCSRGAVRNSLERYRNTGSHLDRPHPRRPRVTTRRQDRNLLHEVFRNRHTTVSRLRTFWRRHHNVNVSGSTVRRRCEIKILFFVRISKFSLILVNILGQDVSNFHYIELIV